MRSSRITGWDKASSPASSAHRPKPETALRRDDDCYESLTLQKYLLRVTLSDNAPRASVKSEHARPISSASPAARHGKQSIFL